MIPWAGIVAGAQGVAGIIGGNRQAGSARESRRTADQLAQLAQEAAMLDQQRVIEYRDDDEARLRAASGFDFSKLVRDAWEAGFNPLTVLNATGGAGYDGRGAVLTTPFLGEAEGAWNRVDVFAGMSGGVTSTAGAGWRAAADALGGIRDQMNTEREQAFERERLQLERAALMGQYRPSSGSIAQTANGSPFHNAPVVSGYALPSPGEYVPGGGFPATLWTSSTQGLGAMLGDALGMTSADANPVTGRRLNETEKRGARLWADYADAISGGILALPAWLQDGTQGAYGWVVEGLTPEYPARVRPNVTPGLPNEPLRGGY